MKFAKYFFASFLLLAITSAFVTPKHNAKWGSHTRYFEYTETNNPFIITDGTNARLTTLGNWTERTSAPTGCGSGTGKICYVTITYTCADDGSDCPTDQQLVNALSSKFNQSLPHSGSFTFDSGSTSVITVNNVGPNSNITVTFTITQKS